MLCLLAVGWILSEAAQPNWAEGARPKTSLVDPLPAPFSDVRKAGQGALAFWKGGGGADWDAALKKMSFPPWRGLWAILFLLRWTNP